MASWKTVRIWLLATLLAGVLCVLVKSILFPNSSQMAVAPFAFPTTVTLPQWQMLDSVQLKIPNDENFIASRRYRYKQNSTLLNIDMHYIINSSGDVKDFLKKHIVSKRTSAPMLIRQKAGIGFYALLTYQGNSYLTSCINPRGGSTVTFDQFRHNRNTYDLQPGRLLLWLLGLTELRDWRCLWSMLSVPVKTGNAEEAYPILESAWFSWFPWWEQHFPQP